MAGRFPGAGSVAEFWQNQLNGFEAISHFAIEELEVPGAAELAKNPNYVRARSVLPDVDLFDAEFFGIHPREAELMDPQHRLFLECCWQAFEDAGYDPAAYSGSIGVFAGSSMPTYFLSRLCTDKDFIPKFTGGYQVGNYAEMLGNSPDFLSTRVSYKLNLRGPSFTVQAGCSTSLVAVCQACQSVLTYQSDMVLAGGVSISLPQRRGSLYQEGGMVSPDGHCRAFDTNAQGTVFGSGVGVVLLKRLEDAVREGDQILGVIRGFALNNDGSGKIGYTAPSIEGQARVISMAHETAGVDPATIGYIEAHGTGTPLGDPIELAALTQAFRVRTSAKQFCVIGTAKTNVGHLDVAAGVTGLIHASQIVHHGVFPPTLHFQRPNPRLNLENSPFFVNAKRTDWKTDGSRRRAGISAFGVGGTNAHVVLEQPPTNLADLTSRPAQLLILSARSESALERATEQLAAHLSSHPEINLADTAWTLQAGRRAFPCRRTIVARDTPAAIAALSQRTRKHVQTRTRRNDQPVVYFLFPGQGSQHVNMAREVYESERVFREAVDLCSEILRPHLETDLRQLLYPLSDASEEIKRQVTETIVAQPAIFTVEYALAQLWMSWGIRPDAMLGHSVGEFVAACLAGVFSLEDALTLIAARGRMMQQVPPGGMLSIRLPESAVRARLNGGGLSVAAVNAPSLCVVAGPFEALDAFEAELSRDATPSRRLVTSHAFHSPMMDPVIEPFAARVEQVRRRAPKMPFISGVTGTWIRDEEAMDSTYWARHLRTPVQFSAGITELLKNPNGVLLEVGPGNVLTTLARQHTGIPNVASEADSITVSSLGDYSSSESDAVHLMNALGSLWLAGARPNWQALHSGERRQRVSLPTYPFERKRYWLETPSTDSHTSSSDQARPLSAGIKTSRSEEMQHVNVNLQAPSTSPSLEVPNRAAQISTTLVEIFEELSGTRISPGDSSTTFLEMGFDSLFLTQVTQALQSKFGLKITFRQLLSDQSTLKSLTQYIDAQLPIDAMKEPPVLPASSPMSVAAFSNGLESSNVLGSVAMPAAPANGGVPASDSAIERLMRDQLQAMNQLFAKQLELLRNAPLSSGSSVTSPTPIISAPLKANEEATVPENHDARLGSGRSASFEKEEFKPFGPYKPPQKTPTGDLTPRQQQYLRTFTERYTKRTAKSKSMTEQYRSPLADPRVVSGFRTQWKEIVYPIFTNRSQGSRLWDVDGNEYIDILNGFGPIMLGHRPDFVEKAVERQLHEGFEIGPQAPLAGEIARMLCEMTGNERMTYCNTGSEAVIAALRVARTVTGRSKVVLFAGSYHGMFDEVLVKGLKASGAPRSLPIAPGIPRESVGNVVVLDYGKPESLDWIRQHGKELAAVLVEPVQSRHPNLQPREFLKEVRSITQESGAALIFDEVVTGFRVHPGGCQALFDIRADLATYGKVLAGGMPIGVLAGKAAFMDALDGGTWQFGDDSFPSVGVTFFAGTFVRHPLTLAAVKAVLQHFKQQGPKLQEQLSSRTASLVRSLNDLLESNNVPTRIENFASIFYFSFPADFPLASLFHYHLREKGVYILEGFPCFLTTSHSDSDIEKIIRAFKESIAEMQAGGIFPEMNADQLPATPDHATSMQALSSAGRSGDTTAVPSSPTEVPLTEAQLEIWLSAQLSDEASCAYNESFTLDMRGALNDGALRTSVQELLNRHEALRASISPERNHLRISPHVELQIAFEDLSSLTQAPRQQRIDELKHQEASTPFDLVNGPLVRARLIRIAPEHHALVFTSHHIVCDGWSTNVLLDELGKLYSAHSQGTNPELAAAVQFSHYAQQQGDNPDQNAANYWLKQFEQPPSVLELPTDRPRPPIKSFKGATYRAQIDAATYKQIKQAGARLGCTLFATLLGGFASLLHRLTAQDDLVIGIPTAGQSLLDNGTLVGHCVNFLPLRIEFSENLTAADLLHQVKRTILDAYEHQNYTYGTLVRKLKLRRDPSRLPLVEVQFNLEKVGTDLELPGLRLDIDPNPKTAVNFDLFMNIVESDKGLLIDCDYNFDLFDRETIARWLTHFEIMLKGIASDAVRSVQRLPLLSDAERRRILLEWNATQRDYPRLKCVHDLIEEQTQRNPDAIAVTFENQSLTYSQLDRQANQLARHLIKVGVTPGSLVGVSMERSLEMLTALLGIWKAGAGYLPLDPAYPRDRISYILEETATPVLITQSKLVPRLPVIDTRLVCLDRDRVLIAREPETNPNVRTSPENVAYTIFTSGSTGKPKGVEVTHANVVNLLCSMKEAPSLAPSDRLLAVTTLSFDIAGLELFLPLITGAQIILCSRETSMDGRLLLKLMKASGVTVMQATPATWRLLLEAGWTTSPHLKILCGGEALPRDLANELIARGEVWNMYGPTETTIWSATSRVEPGNDPVTLGQPIHNTQFYILDKNLELLPVGVAGELYIGGDGVARGYYNKPELTAERFVPDPFSKTPGARLYKTGDLVRYRPDGRLEFLGRLDNQVKVRGFRIELGEIESALVRHPGVRECVVIAQEEEPGLKRLVAYLVADDSQKPASDDLRRWAGSQLPEYMVPSIIVFVPSLPHTPNGKVDRKALASLDAQNLRDSKPFVAARTPTEEKLAQACAEVLRLDRVSVDDSLFDLGADSLHLFQIIARAARTDLTVAPQQLLRLRTISAVAADVDRTHGSNGHSKTSPKLAPVPRELFQVTSVPQAT